DGAVPVRRVGAGRPRHAEALRSLLRARQARARPDQLPLAAGRPEQDRRVAIGPAELGRRDPAPARRGAEEEPELHVRGLDALRHPGLPLDEHAQAAVRQPRAPAGGRVGARQDRDPGGRVLRRRRDRLRGGADGLRLARPRRPLREGPGPREGEGPAGEGRPPEGADGALPRAPAVPGAPQDRRGRPRPAEEDRDRHADRAGRRLRLVRPVQQGRLRDHVRLSGAVDRPGQLLLARPQVRRADQHDLLLEPGCRPADRGGRPGDEPAEAEGALHAAPANRLPRRPADLRPLRDAQLPDAQGGARLDDQPDARDPRRQHVDRVARLLRDAPPPARRGAPPAAAYDEGMERKVATVLFADLVDSTGLVAAADPEVVRQRVKRYFDVASHSIEAHGGTIEKFAGDAVMAAFGVPLAHEDDADRAVRAALEIVPAGDELGLAVRIGVESGEVVVDEGDSTFATGEAVNLAARLQQAAAPGEILLGPAVRRLAAGAVVVEEKGPIAVRGVPEPLWTWRAVAVDESSRSPAAPFVGREAELELLGNLFARAVRDGRVQLVTVFGEPGVGKTRLVGEFLAGLERTTALSGRTLPYGEGVTYWPVASMIKASAGISDDDPATEAFEKLRVSCESEAVADLLAVALGVLGATEEERRPEQLRWAVLRWVEQLAGAQPLVLVFEDVHWAEEPLLDLLEYLARSLRGVPVLIVAVARPELLDVRPSWGGGIRSASAIDLAPLGALESEELADALLSRSNVPPAQRALVLERAEGNPLFLEEIARVLGDDGGLERIPDTVQAVIAARIDRLGAAEKRVVQRAALIGRVFWRGALERLATDVEVAAPLDGLLEREFVVREERSSISGDVAFRFAHVLIRDVAYAGLSKADRAVQHQAFADWVGERARDELA